MIIQSLRDYQLYVKLNKCEFWSNYITSLGHIVSRERISIDMAKVKVVMTWNKLVTMMESHSFLGLARY